MRFNQIVEATLSADQINQLFQQIEQNATSGGSNRTTIGKGKDAYMAGYNSAEQERQAKLAAKQGVQPAAQPGTPAAAPAGTPQAAPAAATPQAAQPGTPAVDNFASKRQAAAAAAQSAMVPKPAAAPAPAATDFAAKRQAGAQAAQAAMVPKPAPAPRKVSRRAPQARVRESINLSEFQVFIIINEAVSQHNKLNEGVKDWLKTKGKNLTTKVTADKLQKAWKKAGSPTDSNEIANILRTNGVSDDIINSTFQSAGIEAPTAAAAPAAATPQTAQPAAAPAPSIGGARPPGQLGGARPTAVTPPAQPAAQPAAQPEPEATPGAGAFGQMAGNLAGRPQASSTGGTTQATATGLKHTANPNNPNNPNQPKVGGGQDVAKLTKGWIQYLKNDRIVSSQSDPQTGALTYNKQPTIDNIREFLKLETDFSDEQIDGAIQSAIQGAPPPAAGAQPAPAAPSPTAPAGGATQPTAPAVKRSARKAIAQPAATPAATPATPAPAKAPRARKSVKEAIRDVQGQSVSEDDVEKIFKALLSQAVKESGKQTAEFNRLLELAGVFR